MNNQTYTITVQRAAYMATIDENIFWTETEFFQNLYEAEQFADYVANWWATESEMNWDYVPVKKGNIVYVAGQPHQVRSVFKDVDGFKYILKNQDSWCTVRRDEFSRNAPTDPTPADDDDDDDVRMFSYMRGELNDMEAQAEAPAPAPADDDDDYNEENHGDLTIELPQEYAVFNLHGKYEELANAMHDRLEKQFRLTTDLFGDSDEPVTIADIDDILDADAYEGWNVFVDGWWDNELRLYAQRADADSEDATPSRYSDWIMIDADHGYLTIGTPV